MDERTRRVLDVLLALQPGEVTTYGDVADVAGYPRQSRLVGRLLATTDLEVPWWRVVNASGRLVPGHEREQTALLLAEGVRVEGGRVRSAPTGRFRRVGPERRSPSTTTSRSTPQPAARSANPVSPPTGRSRP